MLWRPGAGGHVAHFLIDGLVQAEMPVVTPWKIGCLGSCRIYARVAFPRSFELTSFDAGTGSSDAAGGGSGVGAIRPAVGDPRPSQVAPFATFG